jgi:hypothetical protein
VQAKINNATETRITVPASYRMNRREQEVERQVARFRAMEQEVTDPLAARLLHEIVEELEADLANQQQGTRRGSG